MPLKTKPSMPSITRAMEKVSSTDIIVSVAGRSRLISTRCMKTPIPKNSGTVTTSESSGSRPVWSVNHQAR